MAWWDDEDEWRRFRGGYVSEEEERLFRRIMALRGRTSNGGGQGRSSFLRDALKWRRWTVEQGGGGNDDRQVVIKVVGGVKSKQGAAATFKYVSRGRAADSDQDKVQMFDQFGRKLEDAHSLATDWDLLCDDDNRSKRYRDLIGQGEADQANELSYRERLRNVQIWHLIFTLRVFEEEDEEHVAKALTKSVRGVVRDHFAGMGHKVVWGLHRDCPGRPHVHVLVKAESEWTTRLRFDRHGDHVHVLRRRFMRALANMGVTREATRREDREATRSAILRGVEPLRLNEPIHHRFKPQGREQEPSQPDLTRSLRGKSQLFEKVRAWFDKPQQLEGSNPIADLFNHHFDRPVESFAAWRALLMRGAKEDGHNVDAPNGAYAAWLLANRPERFGRLKNELPSDMTPKAIRRLITVNGLPDGPDRLMTTFSPSNDYPPTKKHVRRVHRDRLQLIQSLGRVLRSISDQETVERIARSLFNDLDVKIVPREIRPPMRAIMPTKEVEVAHVSDLDPPVAATPVRPRPARIVAPKTAVRDHPNIQRPQTGMLEPQRGRGIKM